MLALVTCPVYGHHRLPIVCWENRGITAPELLVDKAETEIRYPQAKPALGCISTPTPSPRTLVEMLMNTMAFLEEARYLAKYADVRTNSSPFPQIGQC